MEEVTTETIRTVVDHLCNLASESQRKDPAYKDLFEADGLGALRMLERQMERLVLVFCQARDDKGLPPINNEQFSMLMALPEVIRRLEKHFADTEGRTCCVDKAFWAVARALSAPAPQTGGE